MPKHHMKAPCGGSFYTGTCSLVIMAVKHSPFRVKLLNQYQRNLEKNPYCTVWYTSKKRVTLVTGNHIFSDFPQKVCLRTQEISEMRTLSLLSH